MVKCAERDRRSVEYGMSEATMKMYMNLYEILWLEQGVVGEVCA